MRRGLRARGWTASRAEVRDHGQACATGTVARLPFSNLTPDAALAGFGIALHSTWHVCADLRAGRLVQVLEDYPVADTGIHAVMPQRRLVPPRVRAFVDFLAERFGDNPPWGQAAGA